MSWTKSGRCCGKRRFAKRVHLWAVVFPRMCNSHAQTRCAVAEGEEMRCRRMLVDVEAAVAAAIRKDNQQYSGILLCEESKAKLQVKGVVSIFTIQAANVLRAAA